MIKNHTTADLIINISFGFYLAYYFKLWADKQKDEEYENLVGPVKTDEKCFGCLSLDNGVKLIATILIVKPLMISAFGSETGKTSKSMN